LLGILPKRAFHIFNNNQIRLLGIFELSNGCESVTGNIPKRAFHIFNNQILDSYLHTKSEKIWLLFTFVLNWVFLRFPWQRQAFWNFQASKPFIHMPYNISI